MPAKGDLTIPIFELRGRKGVRSYSMLKPKNNQGVTVIKVLKPRIRPDTVAYHAWTKVLADKPISADEARALVLLAFKDGIRVGSKRERGKRRDKQTKI